MTRMFALGCAWLLVAAVACLAEEVTPDPEGPPGPVRGRGFLIGYSIGVGHVTSDPCGDCWYQPKSLLGFNHTIHVGWMVSRQLAAMLESSGVGTDTADHAVVVLAVQWWPSRTGRFWLKAGLGAGSYVLGDTSNAGSAPMYVSVLGEGGVELVRHGRFTVDLQLRAAGTKPPDSWGSSISGGIGFNWYRGWR